MSSLFKRGGLVLISRIVLVLLIGFIVFLWIYSYTPSKIEVSNSSALEITNNSILLAPHGYVWLSIPKQTEFTAKVNRCQDERSDVKSTFTSGDLVIEYKTFYEKVISSDEGYVVTNLSDNEKEDKIIKNSFYVLTIINDEEQRLYSLNEKFGLEGDVYFRFNSLCQNSSIMISWGEEK